MLAIAKGNYKNIEIIIVDDCSTDESPILVERMEVGCPLTLLRQPENRGPACARNAGAQIARGDYLFFFDSDTEALPDTIEIGVHQMELLGADAITGIYRVEALNPGFVPQYKAFFNHTFFSEKGIIPYEVFDSSRACIKKSVFDDLGGFNENLKWGMDYENEEFGYRLVTRYKNFLVPAVQVGHHFPGLQKLTCTYFKRVAYWVEIFLDRKQFESGGITSSGMGFGTVSILPALTLSFLLIHPYLFALPLVFIAFYLKTYAKFFLLCFSEKGWARGIVLIALNIYFSLVISLGAVYGFLKYFFKRKSAKLSLN